MREMIMRGFFPPSLPLIYVELITTIFACVISFIIYFKTKELYELTSHKGIKYFRYAFLFFGIVSLLKLHRPLSQFLHLGRELSLFFGVRFLIGFAGTMAVLCLLYSLIWKTFSKTKTEDFFAISFIAILISVFSLLFGPRGNLITLIHTLLFLAAAIISVVQLTKKKKGKHHQLAFVYPVLFLSWIMEIAAQISMRISFPLSIWLNVVSSILLFVTLYKILRITP